MIFIEKSLDNIDYGIEVNDDLFEEAEKQLTHVIIDSIYPKIEKVLDNPQGNRKFKLIVGRYMDKNNEKLHTPGPLYLITFGDTDKGEYFELFGLTPKEVKDDVNKVIKSLGSSGGQFLLLRNNPIFWVFYCCIRYFTIKKDDKGLNTALAIYSLSVYPSVFSAFFYKHGYEPNEQVMQYTIDNLTEKFLIKQAGHIFGALFLSIQHSYEFLKSYMADANDLEIIRFIQRIHNDQKSMMKKICDAYMTNYKKGLRVTLTKGTNADIAVDVDSQNKTSTVEFISRKVSLKLLTDGVDLRYASIAAHIAKISVSDTRFYITKLINDRYSDDIEAFIEAILFLYLYDENKQPEEINSKNFLLWCEELFRKTNSNNDNIRRIKITLDKWAEETGVHAKFKREASRVNYKKAIFFYFILSIQKYNN